MSQFNADTVCVIQAHTAPFNSPSTWGGRLPRIPDGAVASTQVQQIRIQTQVTVDADGEYHIVIPGDPFQSFLPIVDSTMANGRGSMAISWPSNITASQQGYFTGSPANQLTGTSYLTNWQALIGETVENVLQGSASAPYGATCDVVNIHNMGNTFDQASLQYQTAFPSLLEQIGNLYQENTMYRVVGQGLRIWSLQGEVAASTGIIRAATIDPDQLRANWCLDCDSGLVTQSGNIQFGINPPFATCIQAVGGFTEAVLPQNPSIYSGVLNAMRSGTPGFKQYLKTTVEASEHKLSYQMLDGRSGATIRSCFTTPSVPLKPLRPKNMLIAAPAQWASALAPAYSSVCTGATQRGIGFLYTPYITGANTPYSVPIGYETLGAMGFLPAWIEGTPSPSYMLPAGATYKAGGYDTLLHGTDHPPGQVFETSNVTGMHLSCTNFTPGLTLYVEYVLTVEVVPTGQSVGLMSTDIKPDSNFPAVLELLNDRAAFPCIATGHSFWKSLGSALRSAERGLASAARSATKIAGAARLAASLL